MPISAYPRPDQRICPATLADILEGSAGSYVSGLPPTAASLAFPSLDEGVWSRFPYEVCELLGKAVVKCVQATLASSRGHRRAALLKRRVPIPLGGITPDDLSLEIRTYNLLWRFMSTVTLPSEQYTVIGELLDLRGFGARCLVDLVSALEVFHVEHPNVTLRNSVPGGSEDEAVTLGHPTIAQPSLNEDLVAAVDLIKGLEHVGDLRSDDVRFGALVHSVDSVAPTLRQLLYRCELGVHGRDTTPDAAQALLDLGSKLERAQHLKLEDELLQLASAVATSRDAELAVRHLGWDGQGGRTLSVLSAEFGISRERVRQVVERVAEALASSRPYTPVLQSTLRVVCEALPAPVAEITDRLHKKGLTRKPFRLEGLRGAARLLDREAPFCIEEIGSSILAVPSHLAGLAATMVTEAKKASARWGLATADEVADRVSEATSLHVRSPTVREVLQAQEGLRWLDDEHKWFWFAERTRNPLVSLIGKVLSVSPRIKIEELRGGIIRPYRMRGIRPPKHVFTELCRQLPICRVEGEYAVAVSPLDWRVVLPRQQAIIVQILLDNGLVMRVEDLEPRCLEQGMKRSTFWVYLSSSPVLARYAHCVYGIRGADVGPDLIESLLLKREVRPALKDYGWTEEGKVWMVFRVSEGMIRSGVISIPAPMRRHLSGEFLLKSAEQAVVGKLVSTDTGTRGFGPLFRQRGGDPGDLLLALFDLSGREVTVWIGDQALIEEILTGG